MKPLCIGELEIKLPVIQGGMGIGVSLSKLAGAVALGGGVGIISAAQVGFQEPDFAKNTLEANIRALKSEIKKAKEIAKGGIIGVNIMVAMTHYEEYVKATIEAGADLIISGAGLPTALPKLVEGSKIKIAPIVSSLKSANVICKLWDRKNHRVPDFVVIEGPKAGGHLGFSLEELEDIENLNYDEEIKKIIAHVKTYEEKYEKKIPVIVAGGIYDKKDIERVEALGADGVQMATRFVTTYECDASDAYKQTYLDAKKEDIQIVKSPVGLPGRAITNTFLKKDHPVSKCYQCLGHCNPKETPYCITDALMQAVLGNTEQGLLFCGTNAYRAEKIEHVSDILEELFC